MKTKPNGKNPGIPSWLFDRMLERKNLCTKYAHSFRRIFGTNLWQFFDLITGFDVVKFDDWLGTPDGTSLSDHLRQAYGDEAHDLVLRLIRTEIAADIPTEPRHSPESGATP